ncbi:MAG: glycosyltransferase family 1 protein [bacterium]|nr:glycosyltransferase family 1 protein [bacterium]
MRIGVDARSLTEIYPSGISVYAYYIIKAMAHVSPDDDFILFVSGRSIKNAPFLRQLDKINNIQVRHLPLPNKIFHGLSLLNLSVKIDRYLGGVDVMFAPNIHLMPLSRDVPLVLTVHDLGFIYYRHFLSRRRKLWHQLVRPQKLINRATSIVAVSEQTRTDLIKSCCVEPEKISTVYSGIPDAEEESKLADIPERYVLALSTVEPRKNITALMVAYDSYLARYPESNLKLVIAGSGGWNSKKLIADIKQHPSMHYLGYVTEQEKTYLLNNASIFFYGSIYEGFGFPPLEALRAGVPVIAGLSGSLPEILKTSAYFIDPYSVEELSQAIYNLDTDISLREGFKKEGIEVIEQLSWKTAATETMKVLREAI